MEAAAWSAIGLLAVVALGSFGSSYYLGGRIHAQGARLGARIDALGSRVDSLESALGARVDALSGRMDEHLRRHAS